MSNFNCKKKKKKTSIKNWPRYHYINHVYIKLTETNGKTNGAQFWNVRDQFCPFQTLGTKHVTLVNVKDQ